MTTSGPRRAAARRLTAAELSWYEVAEAFWLARISGPRTGVPGVTAHDDPTTAASRTPPEPPKRSPAGADPAPRRHYPVPRLRQWPELRRQLTGGSAMPATLPGAGGLARQLRPFKRLVPSHRTQVLDEEATAARTAQDQLWLPVFRPDLEPYWEAVVVVDDHASMSIWRDQVTELIALLRRQGAFRQVRVRRLHTDTKDPAAVVIRAEDPAGRFAAPAGAGAASRRIGLVVTDGTAPAWHAGLVLPVLHAWASRSPLAIIHLLPQEQWHHTGIRPRPLRLRAPAAGAPNARLTWRFQDVLSGLSELDDPPAPAAVPIPVLELGPRWVGAWTRLVTNERPMWIGLPGLLAAPPVAAGVDLPVTGEPSVRGRSTAAKPRQRVREFFARATPTARDLAALLAAAPLNPVLIRTLQRVLLPRSNTGHLAEILTSGLLRPVPAGTGRRLPMVTFDFDPGVREELLATGQRADTIQVWHVVDAVLGRSPTGGPWLGQLLEDPDRAPVPPVSSETAPWLRMIQAVLQALSGRYLPRSRELSETLAVTPTTTTKSHMGVTMESQPEIDAHHDQGFGGEGMPTSSTPGSTVSPVPPQSPPSSGSHLPQATPRPPAIWGNIPNRNPHFIGREKLLAQLHEQIQGGTTAVLPHALHGMGGVGKSHLAIEYVYRHQHEYDLIYWIPAERPAQIGAAMVELAQRMGLEVGTDVGNARNAVQEALRLGAPYRKWLLVFDNAESPEAVRPFFPPGGSGSIMVTSRNPGWASVARTLEVDVFNRGESVRLLRQRGPELADDAADRLAEALGDLPLALEQAAAWRAETGMSADEYLRLLEEKLVELLNQNSPPDYQLPVAVAWNVSLDQLEFTNRAAFGLLKLCAFLAPEPVPRALFNAAYRFDIHPDLNPMLRDSMLLNQAIRAITRFALVRIDHRAGAIQMHRLVQAVLRDRMDDAEQAAMRRSAHLLLAAGDRNDPDTPGNWSNYAELYPHMDASGAVDSPDPGVQRLVENEFTYLYWSGDYAAALELAQRAYDSRRERLGEDDSATLKIGHHLGFILYMLGRYPEAAAQNERVLAGYRRISPGDTEELLRAEGAVAADLRVAGEIARALELEEDLHQRHVRALGPDDPHTLNAAHNLGVCLRLAGQLQRAHDVDEDTYNQLVLLFGADHAITLASRLAMVLDHRELGDYRGARVEMEEIVNHVERVWGPAQTQTLQARRLLASAIRKAGDHPTARALSEESRAGYTSQYGAVHPDALLASLGLSVDLRATGDLTQAAELGEQVHEQYCHLLGDEHMYTVSARLNTAITYRRRGDVALARQVNEEGLAVLVRRLGEDHPLTLAASVNLANDLYQLGEFEAAYAMDAETSQRMKRVFGGDHPSHLICLGNLAMDLLKLGRQAEAYEVHADVVVRLRRALGEDHPATAAGIDLQVRGDCDLDPMPL